MTKFNMTMLAWIFYGLNFLIDVLLLWIGVGEAANFFMEIAEYLLFAIWFAFSGVNVLSAGNRLIFFSRFLLNEIPIVGPLLFGVDKGKVKGGIVAMVSKIVDNTKKEDDLHNQNVQQQLAAEHENKKEKYGAKESQSQNEPSERKVIQGNFGSDIRSNNSDDVPMAA